MYAQLPVFKYQTFDRETLKFSEHPIIPPPPRQMRYSDDDADPGEPPKNEDVPSDLPADTEAADSAIEIIDLSADAPAKGMSIALLYHTSASRTTLILTDTPSDLPDWGSAEPPSDELKAEPADDAPIEEFSEPPAEVEEEPAPAEVEIIPDAAPEDGKDLLS